MSTKPRGFLSVLLAFIMALGVIAVSLTMASADFTTAPMLAGAYGHTLVLKSDGTVYATGFNAGGQLGNGTNVSRSTPVKVSGLDSVTAVAAASSHSLALKSDGTVWAWGSNNSGQVGDGTTTHRNTPVQVTGLTSVTAISAGSYGHSLALKSDGTVWAWGQNEYYQLGDGTSMNSSTPVQVIGLSGVTAIAGGRQFSLALKDDGTVWAWGHSFQCDRMGGDIDTAIDDFSPAMVPGLSGVTAVAAGYDHALALKSDGTVWAWGWNGDGQLGDGTYNWRTRVPLVVRASGLSGVTAIAAGSSLSLALKNDGTVWAWGDNYQRQLGDGTIGLFVPARSNVPVRVKNLDGVAAIESGNTYGLAIKNDGTVWGWGSNNDGELGSISIFTPVHTPAQMKGVGGSGYFNAKGADFSADNTIFNTKYESNFWNWFKFLVLFGWAWMWF